MTKQILIVGAGGIGSWLGFHLYQLSEHKQLNGAYITFADDDTVDMDNLPYQNFELDDVLDLKTESLSARYGFGAVNKRLTKAKELTDYTCIVCAVDNTKFRKLLFETAEKNDFYWIDLRSEGRAIAAFTKHKTNTFEAMMATIPKEVKDGSCQLDYEKKAGIIQNGNKIVGCIGSQYILNWLRGEVNPPRFIHKF